MFNLLPQEQKEELRKEYRYREYVVVSGVFVFLIVVAIASFAPSYIFSLTKRQTLDIERSSLEMRLANDTNEAASLVGRAQKISTALTSVSDIDFSAQLKTIIESRPAGISVVRFSIARGEGNNRVYEIQGIARSRSSLQGFERSLQGIPGLSGVQVPIESYTRESNIPFTITAIMAK